jgi:hypothetical protein
MKETFHGSSCFAGAFLNYKTFGYVVEKWCGKAAQGVLIF